MCETMVTQLRSVGFGDADGAQDRNIRGVDVQVDYLIDEFIGLPDLLAGGNNIAH